jgi:aminoglycoside phosphotransferase family enzyme/predicted kinase
VKTATADRPHPHEASLAAQVRLVAALRRTLGSDVRVLETHISFVLLTGQYAYKVKKAVDLGFLDFRTLSSRSFYCEEELRLNRRTAPDIYLEVVAITGSADAPVLGGDGPPIEFALKMREFRQDALAIHALARGDMSPIFVDALAMQIADLHGAARAADSDGSRGDPDVTLRLALRNFERMRPAIADLGDVGQLDGLRAWTEAEHADLAATERDRRSRARIRECHGDLHLGNIAAIDGKPLIFDCLEFSDDLRWTDVMSDVAFVVMDLRHHRRRDLAYRFLNAYLEVTGDYDGLRVLRFHLVYRAMVRAMVACERARQLDAGTVRDAAVAESRDYLDLAARFAYETNPAIVITHGFSGCGKTTMSQSLAEAIAGVRIRTDVERKRLHGLRPTDRDPAGLGATLYSFEVTRWVYLRVLALTRAAVEAGFPTIVDGAFLWRWQREMFRTLARELGVPFLVVTFKAREATLRERIVQRVQDANDASDADLAVLDQQLRCTQPLETDEGVDTIAIDTEKPVPIDLWGAVGERLECQRTVARAHEPQRASAGHAG